MHEETKQKLIAEVTEIYNLAEVGEKHFGQNFEEGLNGAETYFQMNGKRYKLSLTCLN